MAIEKPTRRMTLRQLMTHSEKCARDLIEHLSSTMLPHVNDFRDLNRPVRRRSCRCFDPTLPPNQIPYRR